jgi:hypothetical protein
MRRAMPLVLMGPTVVLVALIIALALVVVASAISPKPADAATRVVTKTFSSAQPITMPSVGAATPYPAEKNSNFSVRRKIVDVNLTLKNFNHQFSDDADVMLSYRALNRTVFSDVGGNNPANNITIKLDDEATTLLPDETAPTGGTFKPANFAVSGADTFPSPAPAPSGLVSLSGFDGKRADGTWRLWVTDDTAGGTPAEFTGGWSVTIKAKVA